MSRSCPACSRPVRDQSRFCPYCGASLEARLAPGDQLKGGDYRIVRTLTRGGMGAVYLAEDRRAFDRLCVVKQMLEYYDTANPEERLRAQQRFEEEGRTLAALSHPGVPKIYAFFSENNRYYIVMEYIEGETLEVFVTHEDSRGRVVPGKRMPQEEVVRNIIQVCRILEYLHSQPHPIVHQDIKPANLILESHLGYVRLVDFGTAHAEIPRGCALGNGAKASIYGTGGYAPPEQYRGKPEPRSDVFALAATAYHLLTDDDPCNHPFKWPKLKTLPRDLALALERALRPSPQERSTAHELREALEALATPQRMLEAFTFPGGTRIRTVSALPALCDEHWDAGRSFLYNGDFQRWLRDINRLDLVSAADEIVSQQTNRDAGLESFLRIIDPGLTKPKVVIDPATVDLGAIARESALSRRVSLLNATRGYTLATVTTSQPWLEVFPSTLHLWAGRPVDLRINVRAEGLPFRSQQHGVVTIMTADQDVLTIPVTARVSLTREMWRVIWRAISAAVPESWRCARVAWRLTRSVGRAFSKPFVAHPLLVWALWLVFSAALAVGFYYLPPWAEGLSFWGWTLARPETPESYLHPDYLVPILAGPPAVLSALWLAVSLIAPLLGAVWGALRGAFKSFFR